MKGITNLYDYIFHDNLNYDKAAYYFYEECVSYRELQEISAKIATLFLNLKLQSGKRVLFFLNDTPATVACFLAVNKIGAIPVLLNPKSRRNYLQHYLNDSDASLVICESHNFSEVEDVCQSMGIDAQIIIQDLYSSDIEINSNEVLLSNALELSVNEGCHPVNNDTVALWQYTSGTTGMPKAVKHKLSGVMHLNQVYAKGLLNISGDSKIYSTAKMFFGYGLGNSVHFSLLNGATTLIDDRWPSEDIVAENIVKFAPSHFFSVPSLYLKLLDFGETVGNAVGEIAYCVSAGSPLPANVFISWRERYGAEILDGIGATEVGHIFLSNKPSMAKASSTGYPLPGYEVKLVSDNDVFESASQGELYVKGPSLAMGYHNDPLKEKESFKNGWYQTGDVFRKSDDGSYQYISRKGDIFKSKGRWVVPQNFEEFIIKHIGQVEEVALVPSSNIDPTPIMCFVRKEGIRNEVCIKTIVKKYASEIFESHYYPKEFRELESFPRNVNGKVLRNKILQQEAKNTFI